MEKTLDIWLEALKTQKILQEELHKTQGVSPGVEAAYLAVVAEVGEFLSEVKSQWAWWKREDKTFSTSSDKALEELADVLHFVLIVILLARGTNPEDSLRVDYHRYVSQNPSPRVIVLQDRAVHELLYLAGALSFVETSFSYTVNIAELLESVVELGQAFSLSVTPKKLLEVYKKKARVNLERWGADPSILG